MGVRIASAMIVVMASITLVRDVAAQPVPDLPTLPDLPALGQPTPAQPTPAQPSPAQPAPAQSRTLQQQLKDIETQLGKLDFILKNLDELRAEDLPRIQRELRGITETAGRSADTSTSDDLATPDLPLPKEGGTSGPPLPAEGDDDPLSSLFDVGGTDAADADDQPLSVAQSLDEIRHKLQKLDEIAEKLDTLRETDLAAIQRDIRGLVPTSGRSGGQPADSSTAAVDEQEAVVVIDNQTNVAHRVTINGTAMRVSPGRTEIRTKHGPLVTQLTEFEAPNDWGDSHWKMVDGRWQATLELK